MHIRQLGMIAAGLAAVALLAAGCSASGPTDGDASSGEPVDGGTLTWAVPAQPGAGGLDPMVVTNQASFAVLERIYETLLVKDDAGEIQPSLAESYEHPDELTYVFWLRPDVTFSDGTPLTADDIVYTFETYRESTSSSKALLTGLDSVEATDDHTVTFTFAEPNGAFLNGVSNRSSFLIISEDWYESKTPDERQREAMGTGPYTLTSWNDNVDLTLTANDDYWDADVPHIETITMMFVPDESTRLSLAQQGQADLVWFADADVASQAEQAGYTLGEAYNTAKVSVFINPTSGALSDIRVRQALSLAIDRDRLATIGLNGHGEPSLFTVVGDPTAPKPDADTPNYTRDVDEARRLLEEAGQPNPTIELSYPGDLAQQNIPIYELMQEQAAEAGITIDLVETPWSEISRTFTYGDEFTDLVSFGNIYNPDYTGYFNQYLSEAGLLNWWHDNPDAQRAMELLAELQRETDPETRTQLATELNDEVAEKVLNMVAAAAPQTISAWNADRLKGFDTDPYSFFYHLNDAWIAE